MQINRRVLEHGDLELTVPGVGKEKEQAVLDFLKRDPTHVVTPATLSKITGLPQSVFESEGLIEYSL